MAHMDVFNAKPFQMLEMSAAVQKSPYVPGMLGSMNIFTPKPVRTKTVSIEEKTGVLSLIQTSERGAPLEERQNEKRVIRNFNTLRIAKGQTIYADEIDGIRAFGTESELLQVMRAVGEVTSGPTGLINLVDLTLENMRLGAVQGIVTDADSSVLFNWFTEFSISQPAEIDFDLDAASPASGAVRKLCNQVIRGMKRASQGAWIDGQTYVGALVGDDFFDDLTAHSEVRGTYLNQAQAADLRNNFGMAFQSVTYGGILFMNYRGTDDNSTVAVDTDKAKFFPINAPGVFEMVQSPAEFMPFVNTLGERVYSMLVMDKDRQAWVRPEVYAYPLPVCTRPGMLWRAKRT